LFKKLEYLLLFIFIFFVPEENSCQEVTEYISLPEGFSVTVFAENVDGARSMKYSPSGTLFVGTRGQGKVYALRDTDGDKVVDEKYVIASDLNQPNGIALKDGDLYVAEISRIIKFSDIESNLKNPPKPEVVYAQYPTEKHHGWKYIAFGPDGWLYVPVGAPCNICESSDPVFSSITRLNVETGKMEIVHAGVRNTVGITWHPETNEMWFTDNGGDWLGDDMPACELNHAPSAGMHFGYPYCHQGDFPDPELGSKFSCDQFEPPVQKLGPHVAPLGLEFITSSEFPEELKNSILIAEHGSWNRSTPIGYRISLVRMKEGKPTSYEVFADGWLKEDGTFTGRPVDLEWMPDGSLLISDDFGNKIYRISYSGKASN
jgi:glucose/arabinose dehydrogenase